MMINLDRGVVGAVPHLTAMTSCCCWLLLSMPWRRRELLQDGVAVTAAVRPASLSKANSLFADKTFMPEGAKTILKQTEKMGLCYFMQLEETWRL